MSGEPRPATGPQLYFLNQRKLIRFAINEDGPVMSSDVWKVISMVKEEEAKEAAENAGQD